MEAAMRSEEEMMHLILQVAKDDERDNGAWPDCRLRAVPAA